jgi:hypothetical protein
MLIFEPQTGAQAIQPMRPAAAQSHPCQAGNSNLEGHMHVQDVVLPMRPQLSFSTTAAMRATTISSHVLLSASGVWARLMMGRPASTTS